MNFPIRAIILPVPKEAITRTQYAPEVRQAVPAGRRTAARDAPAADAIA